MPEPLQVRRVPPASPLRALAFGFAVLAPPIALAVLVRTGPALRTGAVEILAFWVLTGALLTTSSGEATRSICATWPTGGFPSPRSGSATRGHAPPCSTSWRATASP